MEQRAIEVLLGAQALRQVSESPPAKTIRTDFIFHEGLGYDEKVSGSCFHYLVIVMLSIKMNHWRINRRLKYYLTFNRTLNIMLANFRA